jgi:hypothetical protein
MAENEGRTLRKHLSSPEEKVLSWSVKKRTLALIMTSKQTTLPCSLDNARHFGAFALLL